MFSKYAKLCLEIRFHLEPHNILYNENKIVNLEYSMIEELDSFKEIENIEAILNIEKIKNEKNQSKIFVLIWYFEESIILIY